MENIAKNFEGTKQRDQRDTYVVTSSNDKKRQQNNKATEINVKTKC